MVITLREYKESFHDTQWEIRCEPQELYIAPYYAPKPLHTSKLLDSLIEKVKENA